MSIDYSALAAWAAVAVAAVALLAESRRSRFALGVDLILKLDDRFDSTEMRKARRAAAESLLNKSYSDAGDVLDFFEMVGLLMRRKALDKEVVWETFFYSAHHYWLATQEYIKEQRKQNHTVWENFAYLHNRVAKIEMRKCRSSESDMLLTEEELRKFLIEESKL